MLIDEVHISVKGGNGGDGVIHFYSDRWRPKGGPDGGDGGNGGNVIFKAVSDINRLHQFRHQKDFTAKDGEKGGRNQRSGHAGSDLILEIPIGSVISYDNGTGIELTKDGQTYLAAKGGRGGLGNRHFRSSTNQTPREFKPGQITEVKNIFIQLKLIADVGLIGLPNSGKTSLLNELTGAGAKVANYAFTTLEPNLGVLAGNKIIADIPGLIEGASDGKGLGFKFLKHIERTRLLVHCLSVESENPLKDYQIVRQELDKYSSTLSKKPEILLITKSDLLEDPKTMKNFIKKNKAALVVSVIDPESLVQLKKLLSSKLS